MQTAATPQTCRSCTDINHESQQEIPLETVVPVAKGVRGSPCFGEILSMHGKYGWIKPMQPIDHKDVHKHEGRIYLKAKDMRRGEVPKAKSVVKFFLYADQAGLGAEDCYVVHEAEDQQTVAWASWQKPWQQKWEKKPWQNWSKPWNKWDQKATQSSWKYSSTIRPEPLVMIRPEQLLQPSSLGAATPMHLVSTKSIWSPEKPRRGDTCLSEDDSTSAGDSASNLGEEHDGFMERFLEPPPGLELPA